jgi:hypothetical protein
MYIYTQTNDVSNLETGVEKMLQSLKTKEASTDYMYIHI